MFGKLTTILLLLTPVILQANENELTLQDIVINGSNIGGDIVVNGNLDDIDIEITNSTIAGDITFDNGCAVVGELVYECDGTQRRMNQGEQRKMKERRAQIVRQHKKKSGSRGYRVIVNNKARKNNKNNKNKTNRGKKNQTKVSYKDGATFSPCRTCQKKQPEERGKPPCEPCQNGGNQWGNEHHPSGPNPNEQGGDRWGYNGLKPWGAREYALKQSNETTVEEKEN